ncbi:Las1-domain-containing protein [Linderina pennispora]|uniref:Las1-domain-containing protein n=1 Tax=Linderina pennispora TaxID=61395 RepID=A0A1Y1WJH2_9FUNG|nr:Las1-domain-containing protein [Linderina pennispora]ORX73632.1 Las1-domain-containing protein [Linderina pennispora]
MSLIPKVVPWTSTEEYLGVSDCLYSDDIVERKRGVGIVKAWRVRGKVPAAIDATANLTEIWVADQERSTTMTNNQLRHMYTIAIVRFVNTIVDLEQRGVYAQSVAMLANRIGMPAWFVELRHAGTHKQIPSLTVLRSACDQALQWLYDHYWSKQSRTLPADTLHEIQASLGAYVESRAAAGDGKAKSVKAEKQALGVLADLVGKLHIDAVRLYLVPTLLEVGFLVPTDKKLRPKFPDCKLTYDVVALWKPAFRLFQETWGDLVFFEELLSGIVNLLCPDSSETGIFGMADDAVGTSHAAALVGWVHWILQVYYSPDDSTETISIGSFLECCLRNPSYYARALLKVISTHDPTLKRDLRPFEASAKSKASKQTHASESDMMQEEATMQKRLDEFFGHSDDGMEAVPTSHMDDVPADKSKPMRWQRVPEESWVPGPIGTINGGQIPSLEWPLWLDTISH